MVKTITASYANGYFLSGGTFAVLNPVTVSSSGSIDLGSTTDPAALFGQGAAWTVTNLGTITGDTKAGLQLNGGGVVTNAGSASVSGHYGVAFKTAPGSVVNSATISATGGTSANAIGVVMDTGGGVTNQLGGHISGGGWGIAIAGGGSVLNSGVITGSQRSGIYLVGGTDVVTNTVNGVVSGALGIVLNSAGATVSNAGNIAGAVGPGILFSGGTISNSGLIQGAWGVATGSLVSNNTVINSGVLFGATNGGVYLATGNVTNTVRGQIGGASGVVIKNGAGTVVNAGFIGSTTNGYAIYLASGFANLLVDAPGATFTGQVNGGGGTAAPSGTLELAQYNNTGGVLNGLGSQFVGFKSLNVDAGASWALTGANTLGAGGTVVEQGNLSLDNASFSDAASTTISGAGAGASVVLTGPTGTWIETTQLVIGDTASGSFEINGAATAAAAGLTLGQSAGGTGAIAVSGSHSLLRDSGAVTVGGSGVGDLTVSSGATATVSGAATVASASSASGSEISVNGAGSLLQIAGLLNVGGAGSASLNIGAGGSVSVATLVVGAAAGGGGDAFVSGVGSDLTVIGAATVGGKSQGALEILNGASIAAASLSIGGGSTVSGTIAIAPGNVLVGMGSTLNVSGLIQIGTQVGTASVGGVLDLQGGTIVGGAGTSLKYGASGKLVVTDGGVIDPFATLDLTGASLGQSLSEATVAVLNQSTSPQSEIDVDGGVATIDTPLISHNGKSNASNKLAPWIIDQQIDGDGNYIGNAGTLVLNSNSVDAGQKFSFANQGSVGAGELEIGSQVTVDGSGNVNVVGTAAISGFSGLIDNYETGDEVAVQTYTPAGFSHIAGSTTVVVRDLAGGQPTGAVEGQLIFTNSIAADQAYSDYALSAMALVDVVACFAEGTLIDTADGPVAVEYLAVGAKVLRGHGGEAEVVWIGHRAVDIARHRDPDAIRPVRIAPHAFGQGQPRRELRLSPDHAVYVDNMLIPIRRLINGGSVRQTDTRSVVYYHVEVKQHDILLAEGLPTESYLDTGNRLGFANGGDTVSLHPAFSDISDQKRRELESCAHFATEDAEVEPVWRRLAERSGKLGFASTPEPAFTRDAAPVLSVGRRDIPPIRHSGTSLWFALPRLSGEVRLRSRVGRPARRTPWTDDWRGLGLAVSRILVRSGELVREFPVDHPALGPGWHDVEQDGITMWRWTNGNALLPSALFDDVDGPIMLELRLSCQTDYVVPGEVEGDSRATRFQRLVG